MVVLSTSDVEGGEDLRVIDTESTVTKTSFRFPHGASPYLLLEPSSYAPSPDELGAALFYPDPSQRILAFRFSGTRNFVVIKTKLLLQLVQEQGNRCLSLGELGETVQVDGGGNFSVRISGCRMFIIHKNHGQFALQIYNFGQGSNSKTPNANQGEKEGKTGLIPLPRSSGYLINSFVGHDSIVLYTVSNKTT